MKKITILISIVLSMQILSLFCLAQGSVNSNNALGEPAGNQTNAPYTDTADPSLTDGTALTDTVTDPATDPATETTSYVTTAAPDTVTDTTAVTDTADNGMTAVVVLIVFAVIIAAVIITVLVVKKSRPE